MNPRKALKALRHAVVPMPTSGYRVRGETDTYDCYPDMISGALRCTCRAGKDCSHLLAIQFHNEAQENRSA